MQMLEKEKLKVRRDFLLGILISGSINRNSMVDLVRAEGARVEGLLYGEYKLTEKGLAFLEEWKELT